MTDSAVLAIVRTTNSIAKFDSSAFSKTVPRLQENLTGYEPSKKPNVKTKRNQTQFKKKNPILAASDPQETFECK